MSCKRTYQVCGFSGVTNVTTMTEVCAKPFSLEKRACVSSEKFVINNSSNRMTDVTKEALSLYFVTLVTEMREMGVTDCNKEDSLIVNELGGVSHLSHLSCGESSEVDESLDAEQGEVGFIMAWLQIIVTEGHIEASQPAIGKIVGWPCRKFSINSLFVDFNIWRSQQGLLGGGVPSRKLFYTLTDELFDRRGDSYYFPLLDVCRDRFILLKGKYERP